MVTVEAERTVCSEILFFGVTFSEQVISLHDPILTTRLCSSIVMFSGSMISVPINRPQSRSLTTWNSRVSDANLVFDSFGRYSGMTTVSHESWIALPIPLIFRGLLRDILFVQVPRRCSSLLSIIDIPLPVSRHALLVSPSGSKRYLISQ